ncbi:hypothetical protein GCM10026987_23960 [Belliella aquatica]|uniref:Transposase n=1 Tax=Belliella aquatica TaxID=1323734 RepID=A0ABQ1NAJ9_9BACT|nr:hypothetical protein GCM10010993_37010 [Belliella aquatica]
MAESTVLEDFTNGELKKSCRYFKMKKIDSLKAIAAKKQIKSPIDPNAVLQTDESTIFSNFEDFIDLHVKEISSSKIR